MVASLFVLLIQVSHSYLPGTSRKEYHANDLVSLFASSIISAETQLPFDYFYMPFCKINDYEVESDNIGQALSGDVVAKTPYAVHMNTTTYCEPLCNITMNNGDIRKFKWMIERNYRAMWVVDSLPSGLRKTSMKQGVNVEIFEDGFPLGYETPLSYYVYNHHHIIIKVHNNGESWNIVGFLVQPFSFDNTQGRVCDSDLFSSFVDSSSAFVEVKVQAGAPDIPVISEDLDRFNFSAPQPLAHDIEYTYSVSFELSKVKWASRWDVYLYTSNSKVHWLSILNSFGMVLLLSFIIANVFRKAVSRDINAYNESEDSDLGMDSGWKQLNGDIFRPPAYAGIFSVVIGSGVQVISMCICTLFFASVGFLSPEHRGYLVTTMLLVFAFTGNLAGYAAGRVYKMFSGEHWKQNAMGTALAFPGISFCMFFIINSLIRGEESSGAAPFLSFIELLLIWFGISLPLTFLGAALGYKMPAISNPTQISRITKPAPSSPLKLVYFLVLICGAIPFFSSYIELSYIMSSIWHHSQIYYLFGFLFLCFIVVCLVSGEVAIIVVYILICKEDHRWWWVSVATPGISGGYMFLYAVVYYFRDLSITRVSSTVLYFGYMMMGSAVFFLVTGTVGFISSFVFIRKIYSLIKLD